MTEFDLFGSLVGYGLFILYTFCVLMLSVWIWLAVGLSVALFFFEEHTVDADWRPVAVIVCVLSLVAQWVLLKSANDIIRAMWHSLPPLW